MFSLFNTRFNNPGFIPHKYSYDVSKMSKLLTALYLQTSSYENERIDASSSDLNTYKKNRKEPKFQFILPLECGDGTPIEADWNKKLTSSRKTN